MLSIDGSCFSGSGTIVRQAVAYAALTRQPVRVFNVRASRRPPGLRAQHVRVVEAIGELVAGEAEGVHVGSREFVFRPGRGTPATGYRWDIGSAGSTTLLALAALPVLACSTRPGEVELCGGVFQDFAPSAYHLQHVVLPLLRGPGIEAEVQLLRPGYVPRGGGILRVTVQPTRFPLRPLVQDRPGELERIWGIALASHLVQRRVAHRMAEAAQRGLTVADHTAHFELNYDTTAVQAGAALAAFADLTSGARLGADCAGALRRPSEVIGRRVAQQLREELEAGATLDRHAADQIIPFAALAAGESRFRIAGTTEHLESNVWLAREFLGAQASVHERVLTIKGVAFQP